MTSLIIPAAGKSSRFQTRPKWLLAQPNGKIMLLDAVLQLDLQNVSNIYITILKQHVDKHCGGKTDFIPHTFASAGIKQKVHVCVLSHSTKSQCETIYETIEQNEINGPIFVKDVDNSFRFQPTPSNGVCFISLGDYDDIRRIAAKSFIQINTLNEVTEIVEKQVISDKICVSGYSFESANDFSRYYEETIKIRGIDQGELFTSHIIYKMILDGCVFHGNCVSNFIDWGTYADWIAYKQNFATIFIDLDGVLVENGSEYFEPNWRNTLPITANVEHLQKLRKTKNIHVIITTSRPQSVADETRDLLQKYEIPFDQIIFGLPHCQRILINDFSSTNPFPSAVAVNARRNEATLSETLLTSL